MQILFNFTFDLLYDRNAAPSGRLMCWIAAVAFAASSLLTVSRASAQCCGSSEDEAASCSDNGVLTTIIPGMPLADLQVSSKNKQAVKLFKQGLMLCYAFNHVEAARSFKGAAQLDPDFSMACWGVALAVGPNINTEISPKCWEIARKYIRLAEAAAKRRPVTILENQLIHALDMRYCSVDWKDRAEGAKLYSEAMARAYSESGGQPDVATLYAESMMNLHPWDYWSREGKPIHNTVEILALLESILKKDPHHVGASHFLIHAVEASSNPGAAFNAANFLRRLNPPAGHLVHMPSHCYLRMGELETNPQKKMVLFQAAEQANAKAVALDRRMYGQNPTIDQEDFRLYVGEYTTHNLEFEAVAQYKQANLGLKGKSDEAIKTSLEVLNNVAPFIAGQPDLERYAAPPVQMMANFERWDDLLKLEIPKELSSTSRYPLTHAMWAWGRAMAFAGKGDLAAAEKQKNLYIMYRNRAIRAGAGWGHNTAAAVLCIATHSLSARIAYSAGETELGNREVKAADEALSLLNYDEPDQWYVTVHNTPPSSS